MYQGNPEMQRKYQKRKKRKNGVTVENFIQQIKQEHCYVCTIRHRSLYQPTRC